MNNPGFLENIAVSSIDILVGFERFIFSSCLDFSGVRFIPMEDVEFSTAFLNKVIHMYIHGFCVSNLSTSIGGYG